MSASLAIFSGLSPLEFGALVILGILLYGKNLPTVARTLGRTIAEFRRQMKDVEDKVRREAFQEELRQAREAEDRKDREDSEKEEKRRAKEAEEKKLLQPPPPTVRPMDAPAPASAEAPKAVEATGATAAPAPAPLEEPMAPPAAGPSGPPAPLP